MGRICFSFAALALLVWGASECERLSGTHVFQTAGSLSYANDHGGLWLSWRRNAVGPSTFTVNHEAFLSSAHDLAWPGGGYDSDSVWLLLPYWLLLIPAAMLLVWRAWPKRKERRGFSM